MEASKVKHLEMIQGVVNRLAGNSFALKGWSVTLVSALLALAAAGGQVAFGVIAFLPAVAFWVLDGYFLRQERLYRRLYDSVRSRQEAEIDFSMDTGAFKIDEGWGGAVFSQTLLLFYAALVAVVLIAVVFFAMLR